MQCCASSRVDWENGIYSHLQFRLIYDFPICWRHHSMHSAHEGRRISLTPENFSGFQKLSTTLNPHSEPAYFEQSLTANLVSLRDFLLIRMMEAATALTKNYLLRSRLRNELHKHTHTHASERRNSIPSNPFLSSSSFNSSRVGSRLVSDEGALKRQFVGWARARKPRQFLA